MSYQVLARKWRPYQFDEVVGQAHVLKALGNALNQNRVHHAYLFSGTRGVGKTTIARIFAKGLNCEQGISATPCGQCASCVEIEQGRAVDLLEIDAASRTKVEDTRDLLDNVQYKPARSRFKIYLIDEVHMLSRHSFNALLKTLEEPPEHVKFILATTDPQKLPITILSRCLQFHLKHLQPEQIKAQLGHVLHQEQIDAEPKALALLAHAADGSMRDALSLTDQAIALGNGSVKTEQVSEMLGCIDTDQAISLIETLVKSNASFTFTLIEQFASIGVEWDALLKELTEQLHQIAMVQMLPEVLNKESADTERLLLLSKQLTPQDVQLFYQIALQGRKDLPLAASAKSGFEMVMMRILAFKPASITPMPITGEEESVKPSASLHIKANTYAPKAIQAVKNDSSNALSQQGAPSQSAQLAVQQLPNVEITAKASSSANSLESTQPIENESPLTQKSASTPMNSILAARTLLRSKLKENRDSQQEQISKLKKSDSMLFSASSLLSNIANNETKLASNIEPAKNQKSQNQKDYQWQPSQESIVSDEPSVTPEKIKAILSHERTSEMRKKLEMEAQERDSWSKLASTLTISQMGKLLVLNSSMEKEQAEIHLFLRQSQSHLNNEKNKNEITRALCEHFNENINLTVFLDDTKGVTPLEWRDKLYTEKLSQAVESLQADANIAFICQHFAAVLDEDSIRPI